MPITLPDGRSIPAESIVRMRRQEGPVEITRSDQQRIVTVDGTIADRDLGSIVSDLRASLSQIEIPTGYELKFGGEYEEQQEAFLQIDPRRHPGFGVGLYGNGGAVRVSPRPVHYLVLGSVGIRRGCFGSVSDSNDFQHSGIPGGHCFAWHLC